MNENERTDGAKQFFVCAECGGTYEANPLRMYLNIASNRICETCASEGKCHYDCKSDSAGIMRCPQAFQVIECGLCKEYFFATPGFIFHVGGTEVCEQCATGETKTDGRTEHEDNGL